MLKKNIILLTIDCLRADRIHLDKFLKKTPNIKKIKSRSISFLNSFSNGPWTAMSFPSIMTSTYPLIYPEYKTNLYYLSPKKRTIAEILQKNSLKTAAFHSNPYLSSYFGYDRGFNIFRDFYTKEWRKSIRNQIKNKPYYKAMKAIYEKLSDQKIKIDMYINSKPPYARSEIIFNGAIKWLKSNNDPFFLWIHLMDPHDPYLPPTSIIERIKATRVALRREKGISALSDEDVNYLIKLYDLEIKYVDDQLGIFFNKLEEEGISSDNTYFIITSDHGEELMEHGGIGHGPLLVEPKLYDELINVPLLILGPDINPAESDELVSHLDLAPTILDLLKINIFPLFMGYSLSPIIFDKKVRKKAIISEYMYQNERGYAYRTKKWKYILTYKKDTTKELYDIVFDKNEKYNVISNENTISSKIQKILDEHISLEKKLE